MKNFSSFRFIILAMVIAIGFTSCKKDPARPTTTISGQIINSQNGLGLANATLSFYETNPTTPSFTVLTDGSGYYLSTSAYIGTFTLTITASNYYTQTISNFVISTLPVDNEFDPIIVVQELGAADGVLRVVLTWGVSPSDLDTHLSGPIDGSSYRFHMYYGDKDPNPTVNLDVDNTSSYGPETTTIRSWVTGTYRYSVHNYSWEYTDGALQIYNSPAVVRVYDNSGLIKTYTAPYASSTAGDTWTVFEINATTSGGTIVDKNTYSYVGSDDVPKK